MWLTPKAASNPRISFEDPCWVPTFISTLRGARSSTFWGDVSTADRREVPTATPIPVRPTNFLRFKRASFISTNDQNHAPSREGRCEEMEFQAGLNSPLTPGPSPRWGEGVIRIFSHLQGCRGGLSPTGRTHPEGCAFCPSQEGIFSEALCIGGGVWESNPPIPAESQDTLVLKTRRVTRPQAPPSE